MSKIKLSEDCISQRKAKLLRSNRRHETALRKAKHKRYAKQNRRSHYYIPTTKQVGQYTGEIRVHKWQEPIYTEAEAERVYTDQHGNTRVMRYTYQKCIGYETHETVHRIKRCCWEDLENPEHVKRYYVSGSLGLAKKCLNRKVRHNKLTRYKGKQYRKADDIWSYVD